jgi:hypothetical protein
MDEQYGVRRVQTHEAAKVMCCAPLGLRARPATFAVMYVYKGMPCAQNHPQPKSFVFVGNPQAEGTSCGPVDPRVSKECRMPTATHRRRSVVCLESLATK